MLLILALALAPLAQTPEGGDAPPPPPAPIEQTDEAPPVVDPATPIEPAPPPVVETPLRPEEVPPAPDAAQPAPAPPPVEGVDGFTTGLLQAGVGSALGGVFVAAIRLLALGAAANPLLATVTQTLSCLYCTAVPGAVGVLETALGDAVGKKRAGALMPVLAAYGTGCLAQLAGCGLIFGFLGSAFAQLASGDIQSFVNTVNSADELQIALLVLDIVTPVAMGVVPAVVYGMVAEDKKPGDPGGFDMPGFTSPNHKAPPRGITASTSTSGMTASAMRY